MNGQDSGGPWGLALVSLAIAWCSVPAGAAAPPASRAPAEAAPSKAPAAVGAESAEHARLRAELKKLPHRIVFETYRGGNWELFAMNADGTHPVNLTRTPKAHDLYPHASPDGREICFVVDEGAGKSKVRSVYCMNADGSGRTLVAANARQPCWSPDGRCIAYLKGEYERFTTKDFASKGVFFYDLKTGRHREHVNTKLHHLYNPCWSPDGNWLLATVHGGMGYRHANLAIDAAGTGVFPLGAVKGCRPDVSPDGKKLAWNRSDQLISVADLDLTSRPPRVTDVRQAVLCDKQHEVYHADWSPDGRYLCFSYGPKAGEQVGLMAKDWQICVTDAAHRNVWIVLRTEGLSNKEPDWLPAPRAERK